MPFIKDQDVIQAVAPERPDQPFNIWVLPGRPWRDRAVPNPHRPDSICECPPIGAVIVTHQIGRRRAPRERLHDLLRQPVRRRVRKRATWPAGKWVHPALCSTPPPKKSRRVDGPGGNPTHPCVLSPQVMNGTGTRRQFILKAARLSSRAAFGCWGCAAEREA